MGFIPMVCPQCGAQVQLDDSREFGFCSYCGTKIVQEKVVVEHRGSVGVDHSGEIDNLLRRASEYMQRGDTDGAEIYYNRVLDLDFDNEIARNAMERLNQIVKEPNLFITATTGKLYNKKASIRIKIDGIDYGTIFNGNTGSYKLNVGTHKIRLKINSVPFYKLDFNVEIKNRFTKLQYVATCKIGNVIEIK
ncbi:ribosomal protein L7/L12 [Ruminococcus sp. CAG:488]|nr:ribosomal protein L7/L12 [Ruminococcus sp. CAG:488]